LARLYADENFPYPAVEALRHLGHDVLTAAEAGQAGLKIPDHEVVAFAHAQGRAILTHNRKHFRNLHKIGILHSGLVICTEDPDFASLATRVDAALSTIQELTGELIQVNRLPS
jgi:predicted nuclease of predicted toxin-antitoxin system